MIKSKPPLVTIIVPVHNTECYLSECLSSLYNQTYKNIEIIIVDDGSTDGSSEIIERFYKRNKHRTIVLKNKNPSGCGQLACNQAIKTAKGKYVAIMDSDDVSISDRIEKEVLFLEKHNDYFLVSSSAEIIDENSKKIGEINVGKNYKKILKEIYLTNSIINSSVLYRRSMVSDLYRVEYKACNDYLSWIYHLYEGKKLFTLKNILVKYRTHNSSVTRLNTKRNLKIAFEIKSRAEKMGVFKINLKDKTLIYLQKVLINLLSEKLVDYLYIYKIRVFG